MKKMELTAFTAQFPTLNELRGYGIDVLTAAGETGCANCNGLGKDCERPCKPCAFCEGRGKVEVPLFVLGIPEVPAHFVEERKLSPHFESLAELELHAMGHKEKLLASETARAFAN